MDKIYKACADATRRRILKLLREQDLTAGEIAAHFQLAKPTLSKHFSVLREAGLITDSKSGRSITYHLNPEVLENALLCLMADYDFVWTPSGDITSVARELVDSLVRQDFDTITRDFDSQLATLLTPAKLKAGWDMTIEQFGPFVKQIGANVERYWKFTAVTITCEFARTKLDIKVTFNRTGKISGFFILNGLSDPGGEKQ